MFENQNQGEMFPLQEKIRIEKTEEKNIGVLEKASRKIELIKEMRNQSKPSLLKKAAEEFRQTDPANNPNIINLRNIQDKK